MTKRKLGAVRGQPAKPADEKRARFIHYRVTPEEWDALVRAGGIDPPHGTARRRALDGLNTNKDGSP
jgi:hypothetical protein